MLKILPKAIKSAARVAGEPGRFALEMVRVLPSGAVEGTNGRCCVRVGPCADAVEEGDPALDKPTLLNPASVDGIVAAESKVKRPLNGILGIDTGATNADGHVHILGVRSLLSAAVTKSPGPYPETAEVVPPKTAPGSGMTVFALNVKMLSLMLAAAKDAGVETVRFQVNTVLPEGALAFTHKVGVNGAVRVDGLGTEMTGLPFVGAIAPVSRED